MADNSHFLLKSLNEEQQQAVLHENGPILILAGAGSGKTRVLTNRIAYLIAEKKVPPRRILAMTFTNKAAKEMKERIEAITGEDTSRLWIGTFHSIFARILRYEASALGYSSNYTIYDTTDQQNLIKKIMETRQINTKTISPKNVQNKISSLKNKMISPEEYEKKHKQNNEFETSVQIVYWEYNVRLRHNNAMDFDDLLNHTILLFRENPDILKNYQDRFDHILIDEYQDTNLAQFEIIKLLGMGHQNVCVVGDDDQSIYKWRGAEVENIFKFSEAFPAKTIFRLEQNYRSTPQILEISNSVIQNNSRRMEKELWTNNPHGDRPVLITVNDPRQEAAFFVKKIRELKASHGYDYHDYAILYRTNAQSRYFEEELRKNNIHYLIYGGTRFYERKEIKDMLAYFRLLVNPNDSVSLERIINVPPRKIGARSMEIVDNLARQEQQTSWDIISGFEKYADHFRGNPPFKDFSRLIDSWNEKKEELSLIDLFDLVLKESGLYQHYHVESELDSIDRLENLEQLKTAMAEFEQSNPEEATLENYLQQVSLISDADNPSGQNDGVKMMTTHMAKGLEFPVVFIAGLEENLFPHALSLGSPEDIEEERRLLYVAITRSKERVLLSHCLEREKFYKGGFKYAARQQKSRFLAEIPQSLLELESPVSVIGSRPMSGPNGFISGDWIIHDTYGRGQVVNVEGRAPREQVSVVFDDSTMRTFFSSMAKMRKEE